jgi:hypothetical protein
VQGPRGEAGPRGELGPPGQLPSIEQVMPWLGQIFDAYEEHRRMREREAAERGALEAAVQIAADDDAEDDGDRKEKKKKKHKHKDKD